MRHFKEILFVLILSFLLIFCTNGKQNKNNDTLTQIDTIKPVEKFDTLFIQPIKNYKNDSILNTTDLKVDLLFKQTRYSKRTLKFCVFSLHNIKTLGYDGSKENRGYNYFFHSNDANIILTDKGIILSTEKKKSTQEIAIDFAYGVNKETYTAVYSMRDNIEDYCVNYRFRRDYGELYIKSGISHCGDTGHNPLKIIRKGAKLEFPYLRNILMFENDIDNDGNKEIYLFDYACCINELTIYKIYGY